MHRHLQARQLIFSIASVVVGGGIVLLLYKYIGLTGSAYVAIPCVAPIALGGFYSFNGMNFYKYMGKKLHFMFGNKALTYVMPMASGIMEFLMRIGVALFLPLIIGQEGIFYAEITAWAGAAILLVTTYFLRMHKLTRELDTSQSKAGE